MGKSNIGFSNGLKLRGNVNRIIEMADGGMGDNAIAGHFKDEGVRISPQFVRSIRTEVEEFSQKAVSKASTKRAIKAAKHDRNENLGGRSLTSVNFRQQERLGFPNLFCITPKLS